MNTIKPSQAHFNFPFGLCSLSHLFTYCLFMPLHYTYSTSGFRNLVGSTNAVATALLGSLLGQNFLPKLIFSLSLSKRNYVHIFNWIIWSSLMSLSFNQVYKAKMFSFLTKSPDPEYPDTLESLVNSKISVVTYTGMSHKNAWKPALVVNLEETIESAMEEKRNYPFYYDTLKNSTLYIGEWLNGMREFASKLYAQQHKHLLPNGTFSWRRYTEELAVFEPFKHIFMQRHVMNLFLPDKWVSISISISTFMTAMPWTVDRGYFHPLFKHALGAIFESGLYDRWDRFHDDINGIDNFYHVWWKLHELGINVSAIKFPVLKFGT